MFYAAGFHRNPLFAVSVVAVVFLVSICVLFLLIYQQIGFKVFLNSPGILSEMSINDRQISHMENRVQPESLGRLAGGVGGLRGTCHMLPESGLKQKPSKSKQDRQPDPPCSGGGEIQGTACVQASGVFAK